MSKDISYLFTKKQNKNNGRSGYGAAFRERVKDIPPDKYGLFLKSKGRNKYEKTLWIRKFDF